MSKDKTLEALKKSLQDNLQSIQDRDKAELNEEQKKELKDVIEKVFMQALLDKGKPKDILAKVLKDKDEFLKIFNPWKNDEGKKLIKKFVDNINKSDSNIYFSWLDILNDDKQWEKSTSEEIKEEVKDKNKHVNMRYQIPTHFHGDIDNAVLFHCMENPRGYLGEWKDAQIDEEFAGASLEEFYIESANKRKEESKNIKDIIKERYKLNVVTTDSIKKIIYSDAKEDSPLRRELKNMFDEEENFFEKKYILKPNSNSKKPVLSEEYYYIARYYAQLLDINGENLSKYNIKSNNKEEAQAEQDKAFKISEKICNVEIYPFSSSEPKLDGKGIGNTLLLNSDLSRLGAYIVLRRIYKYLEDYEKSNEKAYKPVFVFRKYDRAWEKLFDKIGVKDNFLQDLESHFFYCQTGQHGGGITSGNVISIKNYKIYKDIFENLKQTAFEEISDVLRRGDIDKNSSGKSGD